MTSQEQEIERLRKGCMVAYVRSGELAGTADEWMLDNWLALAEGRLPPHPDWPLAEKVGTEKK